MLPVFFHTFHSWLTPVVFLGGSAFHLIGWWVAIFGIGGLLLAGLGSGVTFNMYSVMKLTEGEALSLIYP